MDVAVVQARYHAALLQIDQARLRFAFREHLRICARREDAAVRDREYRHLGMFRIESGDPSVVENEIDYVLSLTDVFGLCG